MDSFLAEDCPQVDCSAPIELQGVASSHLSLHESNEPVGHFQHPFRAEFEIPDEEGQMILRYVTERSDPSLAQPVQEQ